MRPDLYGADRLDGWDSKVGSVLDDGKREAMDIKKGDKVLYAKYAGTEFKIDGDELLIVSQKDILAIVAD